MTETLDTSFNGNNSGLQIALNKGVVQYFNTDPENSANRACMKDLQVTDPHEDKSRIESVKGGLLKDAYRWVLDHDDFKAWLHGEHCQLLWIKGNPGKGKTMLLCGIINALTEAVHDTSTIAFFFCQTTDARLNNSTAVIRGLIFMLVEQRPALIAYVRREYDRSGKRVFEGVNAWQALSKLLMDMLQDPLSKTTYLIIDALDECEMNLSQLLSLIAQHTSIPHVKWLVSSRNRVEIERGLRFKQSQTNLSLELSENAQKVSLAVEVYIDHKISELLVLKEDETLRGQVREQVHRKANDTFLWVALVFQELESAHEWDILNVLNEIPGDLVALYDRMLLQTQKLQRNDSEYCQLVLSTAISAYRPLRIVELGALSGLPSRIAEKPEFIVKLVKLCGSFLVIREEEIHIVHQSAKDYLTEHAAATIFPSGPTAIHHDIFSRSLDFIFNTLKRDIYDLADPGISIEHVKPLDPDPLVGAHYSCIYWIEHLKNAQLSRTECNYLQDGSQTHMFFQKKFLHWLEALSMLRCMSEGGLAIWELSTLMRDSPDLQLHGLVEDARRFIASNGEIIRSFPLQTYASALVFGPRANKITEHFWNERVSFIKEIEIFGEYDPCLHKLKFHGAGRLSYKVAFTPDGKTIAVGHDTTIQCFEVATGSLQTTIQGPGRNIKTFAISPDGMTIASGSIDGTIWLSDIATGIHQITLQGHISPVLNITFSPDSTTIISCSADSMLQIWDANAGISRRGIWGFLEGSKIVSICFSPDGKTFSTCSANYVLRIWDTKSGAQREVLQGYEINDSCLSKFGTGVSIFSQDGRTAATTLKDGTVNVWDAVSSTFLHTIQLPGDIIPPRLTPSPGPGRGAMSFEDRAMHFWGAGRIPRALASSLDGRLIALGFGDGTVCLWDVVTGRIQRFKSESLIYSIAVSSDCITLATSSVNSVRLWDTSIHTGPHTLRGHDKPVTTVDISPDGMRAASSAYDNTVRLWDAASGACLHTHRVPDEEVRTDGSSSYGKTIAVTFSPDSKILAAALPDRTIRLWDAATGVLLHELDCRGNMLDRLIFSPDNRTLAAFEEDHTLNNLKKSLATGNISTIHLWEISTGVYRTLAAFEDTNIPQYSHKLIHGLVSAEHLSEASVGGYRPPLQVYKSDVTAFAFSVDGTMAVSGSNVQYIESMRPSFKVRLWDMTTGTNHKRLVGHTSRITAVGFSVCGQKVASGSEDHTIRLWDSKAGIHHKTLMGHTDRIESIVFSPSGLILGSGSLDLTVRLWDIATGEHQQTIKMGEFIPRSLSFSDDGRCLRTNCGIFVSPTAAWSFPSVRPRFRPALIIEKEWVVRDGKRFLFLPTDYRPHSPRSQAVAGNVIVLGHESGGVTFIHFDFGSTSAHFS